MATTTLMAGDVMSDHQEAERELVHVIPNGAVPSTEGMPHFAAAMLRSYWTYGWFSAPEDDAPGCRVVKRYTVRDPEWAVLDWHRNLTVAEDEDDARARVAKCGGRVVRLDVEDGWA